MFLYIFKFFFIRFSISQYNQKNVIKDFIIIIFSITVCDIDSQHTLPCTIKDRNRDFECRILYIVDI